MKSNLEVTINEVFKQLSLGVNTYDEVCVSCCRSTGDTLIKQGGDEVVLSLEQGEMLYKHLKSVFGD